MRQRTHPLRLDTTLPGDVGPYPLHPQPTADDCKTVCTRLSALHGRVQRRRQRALHAAGLGATARGCQVVYAVVRTMLSQNTTDANSSRAMASLMRTFDRDFDRVRQAPLPEVVAAIACGGLARHW